jgi:tight adherence protein C
MFNHPFFMVSPIIRNVEVTLSKVNVTTPAYRIMKGTGMIAGTLIGLVVYLLGTQHLMSPLAGLVVVGALAGFVAPDLYITDREQHIDMEVHNEFPRFLDLLHLYTASAAYENLGSATHAIAGTMNGTLAGQLRELTSLYRFVDRSRFLNEMSIRFNTPLAKDLVSTLRLADEYGGELSTKIGTLAYEAHRERLQNAKKQGQRASAALLIPLMLFHFPVAVVIFLAPTAIALKSVFGW